MERQAFKETHKGRLVVGGAVAPAHAPGRDSFERKMVEEAAKRPVANLNPHGTKQFLNMGYWAAGATTLDQAATELARVVARAADLHAGQRVLDAGCGLGELDFLWLQEHGPKRIVAIDINASQIEAAQESAVARGVADWIDFRVASATSLTALGESFDKVISVEAPHQFVTREDFFREAFQVLGSGGRLVTTDLIPLPGRTVRHFTMNPLNLYSRIVYEQKLSEAGFVNVQVTSIRDLVLAPFTKYMATLPQARGLIGKLRMFQRRRLTARMDYVLATADKPAAIESGPAKL
jgi:ubiquinone/menaquinone biosynthesis C-methylase UbiE